MQVCEPVEDYEQHAALTMVGHEGEDKCNLTRDADIFRVGVEDFSKHTDAFLVCNRLKHTPCFLRLRAGQVRCGTKSLGVSALASSEPGECVCVYTWLGILAVSRCPKGRTGT